MIRFIHNTTNEQTDKLQLFTTKQKYVQCDSKIRKWKRQFISYFFNHKNINKIEIYFSVQVTDQSTRGVRI